MTDAQRWLPVLALEQESQRVFERAGISVLYTGVGKVNAAMVLSRYLAEMRHERQLPAGVINFGSAGSRRFKTGTLVSCTHFVQRDMDVSPLGFAFGTTPFEDRPAVLECASAFPELENATCGTGDSFETGEPRVLSDVVDMEAYALAKVCAAHGVAFACVKFVSDGADHAAAQDWGDNAHKAADEFLRMFQLLSAKKDL